MIKWHDLKRNPTDLPKNEDGCDRSRYLLVYFEADETSNHYDCAYYSFRYKKWFCKWSLSEIQFEVLKWAYVEYTEDAEPSPKADLTKLRDDLIKGTKSVNAGLQEFVTATRDDDKSVFCEALTRSIISSMASEICYGIMKEFDEYGKTD